MSTAGFLDRVYARAADVYRASIVNTSLDYSVTGCASAAYFAGRERRATLNELCAHELAFNALKFQVLLKDVLIDCCFQATQQLPDELMALVMVMLYDLQNRKFSPREPLTENQYGSVEEVRLVEDSLFRFRIKLAASLARFRIKQDLVHIEDILPKSVKEKHQTKHKLPTCAWVNTLKSSMDEVCVVLKAQGFVQVDPHTHLEGNMFCKDTHCTDLLLFPHNARELLDKTTLLLDYTLIIQAKPRSLAVCALRPLLAQNSDILLAGLFSAHTVAHVGVLASVFSNHVYVCGVPANSTYREDLQATLSLIGCKNIRMLSEEFAELSEGDSRLQKVRVVLLLPRCTASALADPVTHIINENADRRLLWDLSQGTVSDNNLEFLTRMQIQDLNRALTFPKVHGVIYCTCSVNDNENQLVVKKALRNATIRDKSRPFRIVSTGWTDHDRFFIMQASSRGDGCFLCVLKREETESVQDILVRAAAKGLLNGLALHEKVIKTKTKYTKGKAPVILPPLFHSPPPPLPSSLVGDLCVSKQVPANPLAVEVTLGHTPDSRCPSAVLNDGPAHHDSAAGMEKTQKKQRRRKPKAANNKGVKSKNRGTQHMRRVKSSRKKQPHVPAV